MIKKDKNRISRYMSKLLRHDPEDLTISKDGYILVSDLLSKIKITMSELEDIVKSNDKQRFEFSIDKRKIKARQGHSNKVVTDLKLEVIDYSSMDGYIYHGTSSKFIDSILKKGLSPMSRLHVHWHDDIKVANKRATQQSKNGHSKIIISLSKDYIGEVLRSDNGVYLTGAVDEKYLIVSYA